MDLGKKSLNILAVWASSVLALNCKYPLAPVADSPLMHSMPIAFGPMPGLRQTNAGFARETAESRFTTASIKFKTSRTLLLNLFPPNSTTYRFKSPRTVAYASFSQTTFKKMEWLGGSRYKHIGLYIHGVEYVKKDGNISSGTYKLLAVLQRNLLTVLLQICLALRIFDGSNCLSMPKIYTSVDIHRREKSYRISTSWKVPYGLILFGTAFGRAIQLLRVGRSAAKTATASQYTDIFPALGPTSKARLRLNTPSLSHTEKTLSNRKLNEFTKRSRRVSRLTLWTGRRYRHPII
jgi:hypothetical protein